MNAKKIIGITLSCMIVLTLTLEAQAASIRVRCEKRQSPARSKISVDGNNLTPRNGTFRARVTSLATGQTVTTALKRAVGDEVEFDFDSAPNQVGATRIPATFIQLRTGSDVRGVILNASGTPVVGASVECTVK